MPHKDKAAKLQYLKDYRVRQKALGPREQQPSADRTSDAVRSGVGGMEYATCTLCASVESSGFYTGCMIADGHCKETGWKCDEHGHLSRPVGAEPGADNGAR
jgi:hypothetical protein